MIIRVLAVLFVVALSACKVEPDIGGNSPLSVLTVSGIQVSLDGSYTTGCRTKSGIDVVEGVVINGTTWSYARSSYSTNDGSCAAGETLAATVIATISAPGSTSAITGWTDSGVATAAPTAVDLSGPLSDTESYTVLSLTTAAATGGGAYTLAAMGDSVSFYYIVDDTGLANVMYIPDFDAANHMLSATPSGNFIKI